MKTEVVEVKSKSEVVAKVETPVYDTLAEATSALGEEVCLKLVNTQNATNLKNKARAEATGAPSTRALQMEVLAGFTPLDPEWQAAIGDPSKIGALVEKRVAELKAKRGAAAAATTESDEAQA